jgi:hypothetical protein
MIKFLANLFRGLSYIVGITAPPPSKTSDASSACGSALSCSFSPSVRFSSTPYLTSVFPNL